MEKTVWKGKRVRHFGWTRLAYLLLVLTVLTILVRMGGSGAEARSLAANTTDAGERRETPAFRQWTEDALSSLEDARGEMGGPNSPKVVEPRVRIASTPEDGATGPARPRAVAATDSTSEREAAGSSAGPPVFYRPPSSDAGSVPGSRSGPVCGDLGSFPESNRIVFPLEREYFYSYEDTWGAARPQGGHEGTDLMTPPGVPEYAVTDGTVVPVSGSNPNGWNTLGGYAVMVRADYSIGPVKQGDLFYYAHLERESPLPIGTRIRAGQVVGYSGDTGQGPEVTRGLFPPHLHLGWYDGTGGRSAVDSGAMNPYPLLEWIKSNGGAVSGGSDARYCEALGPPPSTETDWPNPYDPGVRPDLDTGTTDPSPSPVVEKDPGEERRPTKDTDRPNRPDKPPKKAQNNDQAKPPEANRPQVQKPQRPSRPNDEPPRPTPPGPGQDPTDPSTPRRPQTGSDLPHQQYDPDTGDSSNATGGTTNRPPKDGRKPGAGPAQTNVSDE